MISTAASWVVQCRIDADRWENRERCASEEDAQEELEYVSNAYDSIEWRIAKENETYISATIFGLEWRIVKKTVEVVEPNAALVEK